MTHREEQLILVARKLQARCAEQTQEIAALWQINANLIVERDAADVLLGAAMEHRQEPGDGRDGYLPGV